MFISALVALFAFGFAVFCSLKFSFYLGPTLLAFAWAFLLYALGRHTRWPGVLALIAVLIATPAAYRFGANWKKLIDQDKMLLATAYMQNIERALLKYYEQDRSFPVDETFDDVVWILTELEITSVCTVKYRDVRGRIRTKHLSKPCLNDPWGARYIYAGHKDHAILISSGPDLVVETSDDIVRLVEAP